MDLLAAVSWLPSAGELRLFRPELILVATIVGVLVVPLFAGRRPQLVALVAMIGTVLAALATSSVALDVASGGRAALAPPAGGVAHAIPPMLIADGFTVFFRLLLFVFLIIVICLWMIGSMRREVPGGDAGSDIGSPEFFVLLLTSALGMVFMVSTLNLLVIIVAMETASLPSYAMVASDRRSRRGAEAALKYVMFGAASAAVMVYGASLLYGRFGTLDLPSIASAIAGRGAAAVGGGDLVFWLGVVAFGAGLAFKIAAVPMHYWCPDVFEGAPVEVTTWLSVASKAAGLGLLLRIVDALSVHVGHDGLTLQPLTWGIGGIAALTCTVGNLAALRQESVKRILAYSSIAHAGYMMMAAAILVGPGGASLTPATNIGIGAIIAYLLVYLVMNAGAFGATALVVWLTGSDHLSKFTGLGRRAPWLALPMAVCLFSLVGLPPLGGFAAKWFLIVALGCGAEVQPWLWVLVVVAVVNTALSLYYYVRIIRQMYLTDDEQAPALKVPAAGVVLVNACAVVLLLLGTLWFGPLGRQAGALATNLYGHAGTSVPADVVALGHP